MPRDVQAVRLVALVALRVALEPLLGVAAALVYPIVAVLPATSDHQHPLVAVAPAAAVVRVSADPLKVPSVAPGAPRVVAASRSVSVGKSSTTWKPPRLVACVSARATAKLFVWLVALR